MKTLLDLMEPLLPVYPVTLPHGEMDGGPYPAFRGPIGYCAHHKTWFSWCGHGCGFCRDAETP